MKFQFFPKYFQIQIHSDNRCFGQNCYIQDITGWNEWIISYYLSLIIMNHVVFTIEHSVSIKHIVMQKIHRNAMKSKYACELYEKYAFKYGWMWNGRPYVCLFCSIIIHMHRSIIWPWVFKWANDICRLFIVMWFDGLCQDLNQNHKIVCTKNEYFNLHIFFFCHSIDQNSE